jgi:hypothetical protein
MLAHECGHILASHGKSELTADRAAVAYPVAALRIRELTAWADSDAFRRLTAEGETARPAAAGRVRPRSRQWLADIVSEQRG